VIESPFEGSVVDNQRKSKARLTSAIQFLLDVGIGAFQSDSLVILRTRRVLPLEIEIQLLVNGSFVEELEEGTEEFVLRTCTRIKKSKPDDPAGAAIQKNYGKFNCIEFTH